MRTLSKAFLLLISIITLTSCMTADEARIKFNNEPEQRLCMDYLTLPTYNIWYESRRTAIINRGIDCSKYAAQAQAKIQSDQALMNALVILNQSLNTPTTSNSYGNSLSTGFTKVCYYDGVGGPSALTVSSTTICPLTYSHNISGFTKICHYPNEIGGPKAITVPSLSICPLSYPR